MQTLQNKTGVKPAAHEGSAVHVSYKWNIENT